MNISLLTELGLTKKEADVYLASLELGSSFASAIARKAGVPRVNCYHLLEKLIEKGLVSSMMRGKLRMYYGENPKKLIAMLEEKTERAKHLLPELLSITNTLSFKPKIHFFEGMEGIKTIFRETLEAKKEIVGYTNLQALTELLPDFLADYSREKVKRGIKTRLISPAGKEAKKFISRFYPDTVEARRLIELFFVNRAQFFFENEIAVFENKVAIVSLNPEELIGILVESAVLSRTMKRIFDLSWLGATSFMAS